MQKTIEQRLEWLEEINKLVTKDEFRERMKGENIKFRTVEIEIRSAVNSLSSNIVMVDGRVTSIRWFIGFGVLLILSSQDNIQALVKSIFGF